MICDEPLCQEVVAMIGTISCSTEQVSGDAVEYQGTFHPSFIYPAPPIIESPPAQGGTTGFMIEKSFEIFWVDLQACMNCLRRCLEAILDDFYVPRAFERLGKDKPPNRHRRIEYFQRYIEIVDKRGQIAESFRALKNVGNIGSHHAETEEPEVTRDLILDAYEIFEDCLHHLYGEDNQERIDLIPSRIMNNVRRQ